MKTIQTNNNIASPCIGNCCLDDQDMCVGCFRLIDEILIWGQAETEQKIDILQRCKQRNNSSQ